MQKKVTNNLLKNVIMLIVSAIGIIAFLMIWPKFHPARSRIVTSNFVSYDFARAVSSDPDNVRMLLKPGADMHSYEPTPQDIISIQQAELFVYIGGESEAWVDKILKDSNLPSERVLRLMDYVEAKTEEVKEGMESEDEGDAEYDEHIWTDPKNAIKLVDAISKKLQELESGYATEIQEKTTAYTRRLETIDRTLREVISGAPHRELIFGDRFPFRYFVDAYSLDYFAAFPGCAEQTEASSNTVAFLINKVRETNAKAVFKTELTNGQLAQTIADEAGVRVYELSAAHNISEEDFNGGRTYADIMEQNIDVLREALY